MHSGPSGTPSKPYAPDMSLKDLTDSTLSNYSIPEPNESQPLRHRETKVPDSGLLHSDFWYLTSDFARPCHPAPELPPPPPPPPPPEKPPPVDEAVEKDDIIPLMFEAKASKPARP